MAASHDLLQLSGRRPVSPARTREAATLADKQSDVSRELSLVHERITSADAAGDHHTAARWQAVARRIEGLLEIVARRR